MFEIGILQVVRTAAIWGFASVCAFAQTELKPLREIPLPVSSSRGSYAHFPIPDMAARQFFSMRVAPDESVLVLDSDTSGKWPLVRIRKWWTDKPVSEVVDIPGWSSANAKHIDTIHVDVQITPDGRYAVAFAGAVWMEKSEFIFFAPSGYVARKPDTIVTVVDLEQWKIVSSVHIEDGRIKGVRVVNDKWLALDYSLGAVPVGSLPPQYEVKLISLPDLHSGSECTPDKYALCLEALRATGTSSVQALKALIDRGQDLLPEELLESSRYLGRGDEEFFRQWGSYPYYLLYAENPPLESSSHKWYGLFDSEQRGFYDMEIFDAAGRKQKRQTVPRLLCGDSSLDQRGSACGCRVVDALEKQFDLLALCRTQRGDYDGAVRREWLSVIRMDDASAAGFISLSNKYQHETLEGITLGDSRGYVVTLESGQTLRVYAIPDRQ